MRGVSRETSPLTLEYPCFLSSKFPRTVAPGGEQKSRNARIELSTKVLDRPDRLRSTLAHEMCHVAAWLIDGVSRPPHGAAFRAWATRVARHAKIEVTTCHRYEIAYRHTYVCTTPACGQTYGRHSKSIDVRPNCQKHPWQEWVLTGRGNAELRVQT